MKPQNRFQLDGLVDGFLQMTVINDGEKHHVKVTPRKMLGIVSQLYKIDDKTVRTITMPVNGTITSFTISQPEALKLASEISDLMKWNRGNYKKTRVQYGRN